MKERHFKISVLILCLVFVLCSCGGEGKASYADNSLNKNTESSSEQSSSGEPSSASSEKNSSVNDTQSKNSSNETQSANNSSNTSSDSFPKPAVQGGTVIGTTSKGYTVTEKNGVTYIDGILIVNKTYSLPQNYNPGLASLCSRAFNKMKAAAKKEGISIWISSGFRSYNTQKRLYDSYCERDGVAAAERYSARPGHSEHQSGLAIDVNLASTAAYETTYKAVGEWLKAHCYEYGFVIRYPEGKEGITGYKYEPWHIRYVGGDLAKVLHESGQTLEEYFGITSSYTHVQPPEDNSSSAGSEESGSSSAGNETSSETSSDASSTVSSESSESSEWSAEKEEHNHSF